MPTLIDISLSRIMTVCGIIIVGLTCIGLIITFSLMLAGNATKSDLQELETRIDTKMENMKLEIINAIQQDIQALRQDLQSNRDHANTQMIEHVQNLHASTK